MLALVVSGPGQRTRGSSLYRGPVGRIPIRELAPLADPSADDPLGTTAG